MLICIESFIRHMPPHIGGPLVCAASQASLRHCQCRTRADRDLSVQRRPPTGMLSSWPRCQRRVPVPGALGDKTEGPIPCPLCPPRPLSVSGILPAYGSLAADLGGPFGRTRRLFVHCALQLFSLSSGIFAPLLTGMTTSKPAQKDPVWPFVTRMQGNRVKCNFCATKM